MIPTIIALGHCISISVASPAPQNYRWINVVTNDPHGAFDHKGQVLQAPYIDPPMGGFNYRAADNSPYYWDNEDFDGDARYKINHLENRTDNSLTFTDCPADYRLRANESVDFTTCLVDITADDKEVFCENWSLVKGRRVIRKVQ